MVSLGGVKVISNPNIASITPEKRGTGCYFDHEHPPGHPLTAHQKYSQGIKSNFYHVAAAIIGVVSVIKRLR